jgi:hypothetical protein
MSKWSGVGGDFEPPILLNKLARRWPQHEWVFVGRNSGENAQEAGFPANVRNPWEHWRSEGSRIAKDFRGDDQKVADALHAMTVEEFRNLDGLIVWLGQHGTSNYPIPEVKEPGKLTQPQQAFINYVSFITLGANVWQDENRGLEPIFLCPDARNYHKARDHKHPPIRSIISQYEWTRQQRHYRWGDPEQIPRGIRYSLKDDGNGIWLATHVYSYDALEIVGIPSTMPPIRPWEDRRFNFGMFINEARDYVKWNRLDAVRDWVLPATPDFIHGKWTDKSLATLGVSISPMDWNEMYVRLKETKCTFTTPSSGSGWATTKPWESFATGVACLMHPMYDDQGNIIPTLDQCAGKQGELYDLARWLRCREPEDLQKRVKMLCQDRDAWTWVVQAQRRHFDNAMKENRAIGEIERRLGLKP